MHDKDVVKVENGRIVSPGKFQGEPEWILDLWEKVLSGRSDVSLHDGSTAFDAFEIDDHISELTGYRPNKGTYIVLWSDDKGFVNSMVMDQAALDAIEAPESGELLDSDFDNEPTAEHYIAEIQGFDDYPEYENGY